MVKSGHQFRKITALREHTYSEYTTICELLSVTDTLLFSPFLHPPQRKFRFAEGVSLNDI